MSTSRVKKVKKEKKTPGFKVLDVVIILLVVLAIVGVYFRYNSLESIENKMNMKDYTVSFVIDNIRYTTPDHVHVGDQVYFSDSGERMGTLIAESDDMENIALKCTLASEYFANDEGEMVEVNYPQDTRVRAEGKMICRGSYTEEGTFLVEGSTYLAAGKVIAVQTETVTVSIRIKNIQETAAQ